MRLVKRLISIILIALTGCILIESNFFIILADNKTIIKVAVIVYDTNATYMSEVIKNLKDIQTQNAEKVEFTFFDSNNKQAKENEIVNTIVKKKEFNILFIALVDVNSAYDVINIAKENNIPIVLFNREPPKKSAIQSYNKSIFVGTELEQAGIFEGEILVNEWNKNKVYIDRNKDQTMQYVMLNGPKDNLEAIARAKYSVLTIKNNGIKAVELASSYSDWNDREEAKRITQSFLFRYGDKIEAIISTNDNMAIGAIQELQAAGYNTGIKEKTILVVGVDAIPEARELVNKWIMTGTVIQDAYGMAEALYITGMNLASNKKPLDGTNYKFDDSGVVIRIPYKKYNPS